MFGSKANRRPARHATLAANVKHELACRRLADAIGSLEQEMRRLHPENITPIAYMELRSGQLTMLRELREHELAMADFIRAIGEVGDVSGYP